MSCTQRCSYNPLHTPAAESREGRHDEKRGASGRRRPSWILLCGGKSELEVVYQPDRLGGYRTEAERRGTHCRSGPRENACTRTDSGVDLQGVRALAHAREDEVERVGAGRLQDEIDGRGKVARSRAPGDQDRAGGNVLRQRLNPAIEDDAPKARLLRTAEDARVQRFNGAATMSSPPDAGVRTARM